MTEHDEVGQMGRQFRGQGQFMDVKHESSDMMTNNRPNYAEARMTQMINNPRPIAPMPVVPEPIVASDFVKESYRKSEEKFARIFMPRDDEEEVEEVKEEIVEEPAPPMPEEIVEPAPMPIEQPVPMPMSPPPMSMPPMPTPFLENIAVDKRPLNEPEPMAEETVVEESFEPTSTPEEMTAPAPELTPEPELPPLPEPMTPEPEPVDEILDFSDIHPMDNPEPEIDDVLDMKTTAVQDIQSDILSETATLSEPEPEIAPTPESPLLETVVRLNPENADGKPGAGQEANMDAAIDSPAIDTPPVIYEKGKPVDVATIDAETAALKPAKKKHSTFRFILILLLLMIAGCVAGAMIYIYKPDWLNWIDFLNF